MAGRRAPRGELSGPLLGTGGPFDGGWLLGAVALVGVLAIGVLGRQLARARCALARRQGELVALQAAGSAVLAELSLEAVLHQVVDRATELLAARYGAIAVYADDGTISTFLTAGLSAEEIRRIGPPPTGRGLLGVVMNAGERLRLDQVGDDPRATGFPAEHPPIRSLLALPLVCRTPFRGNLYVAEKAGGQRFEAEDEEALGRFAVQAALAVDNAHLHARAAGAAVAEERLRIAREMHDNEAQVLAYVNAKAQAAAELLRSGRGEEAGRQLDQLAAAARDVYGDVREAILGLRTGTDRGELLASIDAYLDRWSDLSGIAVTRELDERSPEMEPAAELQLLRIVQEALTNVRKHAAAGRVSVRGRRGREGLELVVEDDGRGFDPAAPAAPARGSPRFGLATMRERAEAIGARFDLDSQPGRGTRVAVLYPLATLRASEPSP